MTEQTVWICDICGQLYKSRVQAKKCEDSHVRAVTILKQDEYGERETVPAQYPQRVILEMTDGAQGVYALKMIIPKEVLLQ